jgi:hypothetical protein
MPTVFIPNLPTRYDHEMQVRVPTVDITMATHHGSPRILVPQEVNLSILEPAFAIIDERMREFKKGDLVLAVGDPVLIAYAVNIALRETGNCDVLRWNRNVKSYQSIRMK